MIQDFRDSCIRQSVRRWTISTILFVGCQTSCLLEVQAEENPWVDVRTSKGDFVIELYRDKAPKTVENFMQHVESGFYNGLIFHRVIPNFMIQAGGYTAAFLKKQPLRYSPLEADNGLSNLRGTVALARASDPDSGGSHFYINLANNPHLDASKEYAGMTVFGKVVKGMQTIDRIASMETFATTDSEGKSIRDVPVSAVIIDSMESDFHRQMETWANRPVQSNQEKQDNNPPSIPAIDTTPPQISFNRAIRIVAGSRHTITGRAIDSSGVAIVEVNGKEAELDSQGNFSASILLRPGANPVTVVAYDVHENRASKTITVERKHTSMVADQPAMGQYYALLIGVQEYQHDSLNDLSEPLNDARQVRTVLQNNYTFEAKNITLLENPGRGDVLDAFAEFDRKITPEDSFFVFYAGHGYWDEEIGQGYWLPSDARRESRRDWIPNSTIQDMIKGIQSKHTLLVTDACFSGGLFRTRSAFSDAPAEAQELFKMPSRKAITSGTLTEVPDVSVFVKYFLKRLHENDQQYLPSQQLFMSFRTAVINNSYTHQVPQYGEIRQTGDEGGDFIFVRR